MKIIPNPINRSRGGFTLVEIMIVVAIIALLASIAVPGFMRARKRAQASRVINDLRIIDSAIDQYAIEYNRTTGFHPVWNDLKVYVKKGSDLYNSGKDIFDNTYGPFTVDSLPNVPTATKTSLSDVVDATFWSPYQ